MKTPTVHEFLKSQGIDLDTCEDVAFTSTGKDGIKSPVSAIGTMEAYAKEYHAPQSPVVAEKEAKEKLPTKRRVLNLLNDLIVNHEADAVPLDEDSIKEIRLLEKIYSKK